MESQDDTTSADSALERTAMEAVERQQDTQQRDALTSAAEERIAGSDGFEVFTGQASQDPVGTDTGQMTGQPDLQTSQVESMTQGPPPVGTEGS